ncbi:MAG: hypothetical protein KDE14_12860 [Rhodobacteraceae bacterium]|nr:hypothetical protein [Paracoccaceae bacterium]
MPLLAVYLRIALFVIGLVAAVVLFAFAFTGAAIILLVVLLLGAIFGRRSGTAVWVFNRRSDQSWRRPPVIDHDPNDLPDDLPKDSDRRDT